MIGRSDILNVTASSPRLLIPDEPLRCSSAIRTSQRRHCVALQYQRVPIKVFRTEAASVVSLNVALHHQFVYRRAIRCVHTSHASQRNHCNRVTAPDVFPSKHLEQKLQVSYHSTLPLHRKVADKTNPTLYSSAAVPVSIVTVFAFTAPDVFPSRCLEQSTSVVSLNVTLHHQGC